MDTAATLEWVSVALGVVYVVLAARPSVWCFPFGIASSAIGVGLFVHAGLYSESMLYVAYVVLGVVGWTTWSGAADDRPIAVWPLRWHALGIVGTAAVALAWGAAMAAYTDAAMPVVDAFTTWFSLFATWLVARKLVENWLYWVVIDAVSTWLYASRGLDVYAGLMAVYTVIAVFGFLRWRARWRQQTGLAGAPPQAR